MRDILKTKNVNRKILKEKHDKLGPRTAPPPIYISPNVTESGLCMYGTDQAWILPDYPWQYDRPGHLTIPNPYQPMPDARMWPDANPTLRRVREYDNSVDAQVAGLIRDPYRRYMQERKAPEGVWTLHGYRKYHTRKQTDPDLEELRKLIAITQY